MKDWIIYIYIYIIFYRFNTNAIKPVKIEIYLKWNISTVLEKRIRYSILSVWFKLLTAEMDYRLTLNFVQIMCYNRKTKLIEKQSSVWVNFFLEIIYRHKKSDNLTMKN